MKSFLAIGLFILIATGCSTVKSWMPGQSSDSLGDQMLSEAKETSELGKSWNEGQKKISKAEKLMARSESLARESQKLKAEAEGLLAEGNGLVESSEQNYRVAFGEDATPAR